MLASHIRVRAGCIQSTSSNTFGATSHQCTPGAVRCSTVLCPASRAEPAGRRAGSRGAHPQPPAHRPGWEPGRTGRPAQLCPALCSGQAWTQEILRPAGRPWRGWKRGGQQVREEVGERRVRGVRGVVLVQPWSTPAPVPTSPSPHQHLFPGTGCGYRGHAPPPPPPPQPPARGQGHSLEAHLSCALMRVRYACV